jgi:hypothetical protein
MSKRFYILLWSIVVNISYSQGKISIIDEDNNQNCNYNSYHLEVIQQNSAYAYSRKIVINDSVIQIYFLGGLQHEEPKICWTKKIDHFVADSICNLLKVSGLDTIQRVYMNPAILDGLVIAFKIRFQQKETRVQLMNYWIEPLYNLVLFVNKSLPEEYKMDLRIPKTKWE